MSEIILKKLDTGDVGFVTVSGVKVSTDLKYARVYVSVLNRTVSRRSVEKFFAHQAKHVRRLLGSQITSKSVPFLKFFYDETYEEAEKLDRLFAKIEKPDASKT